MAHDKRRVLHTQQATVVFKGVGQDVHVILDPSAPFPEIDRELREHLERAGDFFAGAAVTLLVGSRQLRDEHLQTLQQTLTAHGLTVAEVRSDPTEGAPPLLPLPPKPPTHVPASPKQSVNQRRLLTRDREVLRDNALLLKGTLRSGQRIYAEHNLVVFGDVNPGAELIAGGDILVMGTLRGVAHAGVPDNIDAIIAALSLKPTQLRIGHFISRSPEFQEKHDSGPELAKVDGQQIVIDSFPRRLLGAS